MFHIIRIRACQNNIQHAVIFMDLLNVNVILDMRVIPLMMNVENKHMNVPKMRKLKV